MPQCWTSDNTDALDRIKIQQGTSYGYPQSVMTMHVSAAPSSASLRPSSVEERFNVAAFGLLGYELDVTRLNKFDKVAIKEQIKFYKKHRKLLQYGDFYRIGDFFTDDISKWQISSYDKSESMAGYFTDRTSPNNGNDTIRFVGLDEEKDYSLKSRLQLLSLRNFDSLISMVMPKQIDVEEGKLFEYLVNTVRLHTEKENYDCIGGDALMSAGFKPHQRFVLSGFKPGVSRMLLDTDSRMYYISENNSK